MKHTIDALAEQIKRLNGALLAISIRADIVEVSFSCDVRGIHSTIVLDDSEPCGESLARLLIEMREEVELTDFGEFV